MYGACSSCQMPADGSPFVSLALILQPHHGYLISPMSGKSSLEDSLSFSAMIDDGTDAVRGGHLFLQTRNSLLLSTKWRWLFCRIAATPLSQQGQQQEQQQGQQQQQQEQHQQQQQQLQYELLLFDSFESSSDYTCRPLDAIPLTASRCFPQMFQASFCCKNRARKQTENPCDFVQTCVGMWGCVGCGLKIVG
jgi:hypothetical protein